MNLKHFLETKELWFFSICFNSAIWSSGNMPRWQT